MHVSWVLEQLCCPPQHLLVVLLLQLQGMLGNIVQHGVGFCKGVALWCNIPIMKTPVIHCCVHMRRDHEGREHEEYTSVYEYTPVCM